MPSSPIRSSTASCPIVPRPLAICPVSHLQNCQAQGPPSCRSAQPVQSAATLPDPHIDMESVAWHSTRESRRRTEPGTWWGLAQFSVKILNFYGFSPYPLLRGILLRPEPCEDRFRLRSTLGSPPTLRPQSPPPSTVHRLREMLWTNPMTSLFCRRCRRRANRMGWEWTRNRICNSRAADRPPVRGTTRSSKFRSAEEPNFWEILGFTKKISLKIRAFWVEIEIYRFSNCKLNIFFRSIAAYLEQHKPLLARQFLCPTKGTHLPKWKNDVFGAINRIILEGKRVWRRTRRTLGLVRTDSRGHRWRSQSHEFLRWRKLTFQRVSVGVWNSNPSMFIVSARFIVYEQQPSKSTASRSSALPVGSFSGRLRRTLTTTDQQQEPSTSSNAPGHVPKSATCALPLSSIGAQQRTEAEEEPKKELDNIRYLHTSPNSSASDAQSPSSPNAKVVKASERYGRHLSFLDTIPCFYLFCSEEEEDEVGMEEPIQLPFAAAEEYMGKLTQ